MSAAVAPIWGWPEATWRGRVAAVRAGRSLAPRSWPGGARAAVALSIDPDHETISFSLGSAHPGPLSEDEYGPRVGTPRLLALLGRLGIPVSIFMPAVSAALHPDEVRRYVDAGHEVGMHGWIHEDATELPAGMERELLLRAADTLERLTGGRRPVG